jgi:hypothetical protein
MRVLETIPKLDLKRLADLEANANRQVTAGTEKQRAEAESVLMAIRAERVARKKDTDEEQKRVATEIAARVKDMGLFERVVMAFSEILPEHWEVEVLSEISARPGQNFDKIAHAIAKRGGGYINLAVGTICSTREVYLGPAPVAKKVKGVKVYSALIIDFEHHKEADGTEWHGWTLKPEADAALRSLKIIK